MQPTNKQTKHKSRCNYCGSTDYGKGCRYGPAGVHLHSDNPLKCSYCGSSDYGKGCKLNPMNNLHIRGSVFNNMYKETIQSFLDSKILIKELKKPYVEFQCYKLSIIDENGNKIKNPETIEEWAAYDSMTRTILKLKRYLGSKLELLEAFNEIQNNSNYLSENIEYFNKVLHFQEKADILIEELYKLLSEAQNEGISFSEFKKIIKA